MASDPARATADRHRLACRGFGVVVSRVGDAWGNPSPCTEWDARAVLEHVIGFHDVLLLRPLRAKPQRPKDDPVARWQVTETAIGDVIGAHVSAHVADHVVDMPGGRTMDLERLLPMLTTDVLAHTWDLARAAGVPADLDSDLCERSLVAVRDASAIAASGLYDPPVEVPSGAGVEERLMASLGRDPGWAPR
jgi:uncharacterized protein (TIGR03086 family)